ncbi:PKD domain-containing protein [Salinibacter grassmerensis]|uniref:PKD domain-containing protein n=1 Tax=Salinibacter grassmerensis TaxID=3040353 RepID=UPI0021E8E416|nr:PKD domain-containing protein [Salinibacter grassmerensis]
MRTRYSILSTLLVLSLSIFAVGCDSSNEDGDLVASFEVETNNSTVNLRDRSRYPGGEIDSRTWELGDGATAEGQGVEYTYDEPGTYTVELTTEGTDGTTNSTTREVSIGTQRFEVTIENVGQIAAPGDSTLPITKSGTFGGMSPIGSGDTETFRFSVGAEELPGTGMALSFASRHIPSDDADDAFYAFRPEGIPLFRESGAPLGQDGPVSVTDSVRLWDAGTEAPDDQIVEITDDNGDGMLEEEGVQYPATSDVISVSIESKEDPVSAGGSGGYEFTVTVENVADPSQNIELSPGTYAAHFDQTPAADPSDVSPEEDVRYPGFIGLEDSTASTGLADLAQNGDPSAHATELDGATGITVPLSPGAVATHSDDIQPFRLTRAAYGGIESLAEDGNPGTLVETLGGASAVTDGASFGGGPLLPTKEVTFIVDADTPGDDYPGDRLSIATMHIQSNDYFYAFDPAGLPLFKENGDPINRNVTDALSLYDAHTESDQEPGVGVNQAPRQSGANTGPSESGTVERVASDIEDTPLFDVIEVTVTPVSP